ncbi:MAG: hypothetical protein VX548_05085, partial [Bacteroidota bacterium]|nr:hypothetical protein [Bacteroidota bacterium]
MQKVLFILFTLWFTGISAQTELPTLGVFLKDLESDLSKSLPNQAKWLSSEFTKSFNSSSATRAMQDTVISTVMQLQETNIKLSTGIFGYLEGVNAQLNSDSLRMEIWDGWHKSIISLNENRRWYK